jgi:hypothetical protein
MKTPHRLTAALACYKVTEFGHRQCNDMTRIQSTNKYHEYKEAGGVLDKNGYFVVGGLLMDEDLLPLHKIK